jgi:hypothetical protein
MLDSAILGNYVTHETLSGSVLTLTADGTFQYVNYFDMGNGPLTTGKWTFDGKALSLEALDHKADHPPPPRSLVPRQWKGARFLLKPDEIEDFAKNGPIDIDFVVGEFKQNFHTRSAAELAATF